MITGIDHVVILVRDLAAAMDDYGRLGFTVVYGGAHPGGTHNALIAFEDGSYLELIAFQDPDAPHDHPWHDALARGEGLVAFAIGSTDLAADLEAARSRGLTVGAIQDGGRERPDGARLAWRTAGIGAGKRGRERPFAIEDVTPREWRVASGWQARHGNSVVGIGDVTLVVGDLDRAVADLVTVLDVPSPPLPTGGGTRHATLATPRGTLVLIQPDEGEMAETQRERGDYLAAATLLQMAQGGEPAYEPDRAHGADLGFRPA